MAVEIKNILIIVGSVFLITGCGQKLGNHYFDFDAIDFYTIDINESVLFKSENDSSLSKEEKLQIDLTLNSVPTSMADTSFIQDLETVGFTKKLIDDKNIESINNIFRYKTHKEVEYAKCAPVYRDILIFRKEGEVIGIAKICFSCSQNQIMGTSENTMEFGQSGDYNKLGKLLNELQLKLRVNSGKPIGQQSARIIS